MSVLRGSPRSVIRRVLGFPRNCNGFDLYLRSLRQRRDLYGGTCRGVLFEIRTVDFVHRLKISQISEENGCLNNIIKSEPLGSQNGCNVVQRPPRLCRDIAGNDLARFRVERNLAAAKEEASAAHSLRVGADRPGRFVRGNDLLHVVDSNCKFKPDNRVRSGSGRRIMRRFFPVHKGGLAFIAVLTMIF